MNIKFMQLFSTSHSDNSNCHVRVLGVLTRTGTQFVKNTRSEGRLAVFQQRLEQSPARTLVNFFMFCLQVTDQNG
jgi:hypothetical protein